MFSIMCLSMCGYMSLRSIRRDMIGWWAASRGDGRRGGLRWSRMDILGKVREMAKKVGGR